MTRRNVTTKGPVAIVIAAIVFAACSAYRPPSLPREHPASPEAAAAPVPAPSKALTWESPAEPPKPAGKATSHAGHSGAPLTGGGEVKADAEAKGHGGHR